MVRRPRKRVARRRVRSRPTRSTRQQSSLVPSLPTRLHNLPTQLTTFIGREREIAEIRCLLGTTRLLTLTGSGGCGKTRLALQVAADLLDEFPDGVRMVDFAPLSIPALVPQAVAAALEVSEQPKRSLQDTLADSLRCRTFLLLLDNCEHVLTSCANLALALLRDCSDLRILATSREPLGIAGEIRWTVPALSLPDSGCPQAGQDLTKYEAVRLFRDRAVAVRPAFAITDSNARIVASLCGQLDGIPLAIEMAAAWVRVLTVEEILNRLSDRFRLLRSAGRATLSRHQTLKMAMDWSYESLPEPERLLLSRLSVFAGGWTLDAAETICSGTGVQRVTILSLLTHLVDTSLVVAETGGGAARYRLLETVRQYGRGRLMESGDAAEVQRRHYDWYLNLADRANAALRGSQQVTWLERLESEHDNLRAALEWSKMDGRAQMWLRLAAALHQFWFMRGYFSEGREWLDGALSVDQASRVPARAWALCGAGMFAWRLGDVKGRTLLQQSLALFEELKDQRGAAYVLHHLAHVMEGQDDFGGAMEMLERSVALFKEVEDNWGVGWSLLCLGDSMLLQGNDDRGAAFLEQSLLLCRDVGSPHTLAYVLASLGKIADRRRDYERATALLEESYTMARQVGDKYHIPSLLCDLASVSLAQGHTERALALYKESVTLRREVGDKPRLVVSLEGLASVASALGDHGRAARLFGAAEALRGPGLKRWPADPIDRDRRLAATRTALGETSFNAAGAEGRMMSLETIIEYARSVPEARRANNVDHVKPAPGKRAGLLAPREREVAVLIADGKTNREIAARLSIAESTAETHVQHILNKLGFNSRAQIAAWAGAHGLRTPSSSPSILRSDR